MRCNGPAIWLQLCCNVLVRCLHGLLCWGQQCPQPPCLSAVTPCVGARTRTCAMLYTFGDCTLDTQLYTLQRAGQTLRLRPKVFQVLCHLLAHPERVIPKDELVAAIWPGQFI